jgi:predicted Holliday junction resolvase-like endonuclease
MFFLKNIRSLPESGRKIIFWVVFFLLAVGLVLGEARLIKKKLTTFKGEDVFKEIDFSVFKKNSRERKKEAERDWKEIEELQKEIEAATKEEEKARPAN